MEATSTYNVNLVLNESKNGIELHFDSWPGKEIIDELKENNFRWHNTKKMWYAKNTPERLSLAQRISCVEHIRTVSEIIESIEQDIQNDSITEEDIDIILCRGSGFAEGKMRIYEQFLKNETDGKNAEFLKNEYGTGGSTVVGTSKHIWQNHNAKGIEVILWSKEKKSKSLLLSWNDVAKRIGVLIKQEKYLTEEEKGYYPTYLKKKHDKEERSKVANAFIEIVREYNELMYSNGTKESVLSLYILSGCASALTQGDKKTWTTTRHGDFVVPLVKEALEKIIQADTHLTERCKEVLKEFDNERMKELEPDASDYESQHKFAWDEYETIKAEHPDNIVLYQVGAFMEIMGPDAEKISDQFDLQLAFRSSSTHKDIPFIGISKSYLKNFEERLSDNGYTPFVVFSDGKTYEVKDVIEESIDEPVSTVVKEDGGKSVNSFANTYDFIGDEAVVKNSDISIASSISSGMYLEDLNIHYKRYNGSEAIRITELDNANKKGKECIKWSLFGEDMTSLLYDAGIDTVEKLYSALKSDNIPEGINVYSSTLKGKDVFSPFIEYKPLDKVPDKWNKTTFIHALQSGQIFSGEINSRYTDDYRGDYASGYSNGVRLDMSCAAVKEMDDWGSLSSARSGQMSSDGIIPVVIYNAGTTKTYYFDMNCDIAKGKQRREEIDNARERYNQMMEASCMKITKNDIDKNEIYSLKSLRIDSNTDVYVTKDEVLQGQTLIDRVYDEPYYAFKFEVFPIDNTKFYSISNFYDRASSLLEKDSRLIPLGNWEHIVSGKALKEITEENLFCPHIRIGPHEGDYSKIYSDIQNRLETNSNFTHGDRADYATTLKKLESEYVRAGKGKTAALSDLIKNAKAGESEKVHPSILRERNKDGELEK